MRVEGVAASIIHFGRLMVVGSAQSRPAIAASKSPAITIATAPASLLNRVEVLTVGDQPLLQRASEQGTYLLFA
jgi:hypothetical protein